MREAESSTTGIQEISFSVVPDRRRHHGDSMKHAAVDLHNQLVALGLQPTELSATHFVVKVDPARKQDHWALINNMQKLIDQRILPIVIAVRTVGGEVMRPIHPDAPPMMAKLEDLQQLPIEERKVQMGIN